MKAFTIVTVLFCIAGFATKSHAQNTIFLTEGKIEFEKRVNQYALMEEGDSWNDLQKKTMPKFKVTYFDLLFTHNKTIYQPGRENPDNNNNQMWGESLAAENVVYADLDSSRAHQPEKSI